MKKRKKLVLVTTVLLLLSSVAYGIYMPSFEEELALGTRLDAGSLKTTYEQKIDSLELVSGSGIAKLTELNKNQFCFGLGDFAKTGLFEIKEIAGEQFLLYRGKEDLEKVKAITMCGRNEVNIMELVADYSSQLDWGFSEDALPDCDLCNDEKCCAIILTTDESKESLSKIEVLQVNFEEIVQKKKSFEDLQNFNNALWSVFSFLAPVILIFGGAFFLSKRRYAIGIGLILLGIILTAVLIPINY